MDYISFIQLLWNAKADFFVMLSRTWNYAQKYKQEYSKDDMRSDFYIIFSQLNLWLLLQFDYLLEMLEPTDKKISKYMNLATESRRVFLLQYDTINRATYCSTAMFDIEHFLATVSKALGLPTKKGFFNISKQVLQYLDIEDQEKKLRVLNVPAKIRNSLHNDGVFNEKEDYEIVLRGRHYKLTVGTKVDCSGWNNLYIFFDEVLNILVEICERPSVRQLTKIARTSMAQDELFKGEH